MKALISFVNIVCLTLSSDLPSNSPTKQPSIKTTIDNSPSNAAKTVGWVFFSIVVVLTLFAFAYIGYNNWLKSKFGSSKDKQQPLMKYNDEEKANNKTNETKEKKDVNSNPLIDVNEQKGNWDMNPLIDSNENENLLEDEKENGSITSNEQWKEWKKEEIISWLLTIENGKFQQYKEIFDQYVKDSTLKTFNEDTFYKDLTNWGIKKYAEKSQLIDLIVELTEGQLGDNSPIDLNDEDDDGDDAPEVHEPIQ